MTKGWSLHLTRRSTAAAVAAVLAFALTGVPAVRAALPDLRVVSDTTYEVRPADGVVHVTIDGAATSYKADSGSNTYYFTGVRLVIFSGATHLSATAAGLRASVTVVDTQDYQQVVEIALNRALYYQQTGAFRLEYDLPTGSAGGEVRVGITLAAFPVWAAGSSQTPGSSVAISLPRGFQLDLQGGDLPTPEAGSDGGHVYRWTDIADPDAFWLFATADQATITDSTYREFTSQVDVGSRPVDLVVKAWTDDSAWGTRTLGRITQGLPVLGDLIGVRYFGTSRLIIIETVSRSLNGYAGIFDNSQPVDEIQVAYDADDTVTLHEAAHAWFNGSLSSDRWVLEGFASYYGALAAEKLGIQPETFDLTDELRAAAFPLAEWGYPGVESQDRELYAYAASLEAARELAGRAGNAGLATVFSAMADDESAYQPLDATTPDVSYTHTSNWHYLLDLLEERTGRAYDDILREWVVSPGDLQLLDERSQARDDYAAFLSRLDGWQIPEPLRRQMNAWAFSAAEESITQASDVLEARNALDDRATELGVTVPLDGVRAGFEGNRMQEAATLTGTIGAALDAYQAAEEATSASPDLVQWFGLFGEDPQAHLADAAAALQKGTWDVASAAADDARAMREDAASVGTTRLAIGGGTVAVLLLGGIGAISLRRRRRRRVVVPAGAVPPVSAASAEERGSAGLAGDAGDVADALDPAQDAGELLERGDLEGGADGGGPVGPRPD